MKTLFNILILVGSFGLWAQQLPVNCNLAVPGCSTPQFAVVGTQPSYNITDFGSGTVSNPSSNPQGVNSGCLLSGETVSTFIEINVVTNGTLEWSMIGSAGGCFDWIMWPNVNNGACAGINGNTLPPVACNWNGMCNGNTGMSTPANYPPGASSSSYQPPLTVTAGQSFILCLSNYSFTNQNVNLSFFGTASVVCGVNAADQTICLGNSAQVTIATPGYTNPTFNWLVTNGVSNTSGGTNVTVTPTVTTTYQVVVSQTIPSPMQDTATFTITVATPPAPNAGPDQIVCLGSPINLAGTVGSAGNSTNWQVIVPPGMTPPATATFSPNFSSLTPTVTVNQLGVYKFILRESSTICGMIRDTVLVTVSQLQITATKTDPICNGSSDGTITITSAGADQYSFDNGTTWQASNTLGGFAAGTYTVWAKNPLGCSKSTTITLSNPPGVTISVSNDTIVCQNGTATLSATATGGTTYSFHWSHDPSLLATVSVSPSATAYYKVQAENQVGCFSPFDSILVTVRNPISGILSPDVYVCPGYPDSLMVTPTEGIGAPYTFTWSSGEVQTGVEGKIVKSPTQDQSYSVTIKDACESTPLVLTGNIKVFAVPVPQIGIDLNPKCEPATFYLYNQTISSMSANAHWKISNGDVFDGLDTVLTTEMMNGNYDVQLIITSPDGCIDSTTFLQYINVKKKPHADFVWSPDPVTMFNTTVNFIEISQNADSFEWSFPGGNPTSSNQPEKTVQYPDGQISTYYITLVAHSELGCTDTITKHFTVQPEVILYAPNCFTPDGDEFNQTWRVFIEGVDLYHFNLKIFDRWGEVIWETMDPEASWDGTYQGKVVPYGSYTWLITTKEKVTDKKFTWTGSISIIR